MPTRPPLRALPGLLLVMVLVPLDQTAIAPALPEIAGDLGGIRQMPMVVTAYVVAVTVAMPVYGVLSDRRGRKPVLMTAIVLFVAGALACAFAPSLGIFVAARVVQGLGGGGLMVGAQATLGDLISPRERGRYLGLFGVAYVVPAVAGPLVGGLLVEVASWRWIFAIHVPLGVIALVTLALTLHLPSRPDAPTPEDDTGRLAATFGRRGVLIPMLLSITVGFALFGTVSYVPALARIGFGMSGVQAGLVVTSMMGGAIITMTVSGRLITKHGTYRRFPIMGTALMFLGALTLGLLGTRLTITTLLVVLFVIGLGIGMVMQVMMLVAQNAADPLAIGVVTSGVLFVRQIGASVGAGVVGALVTSSFASRLPQLPEAATMTPDEIAALPPNLAALVAEAFGGAVPAAILTVTPLLAVSFCLALALPALPLRTKQEIESLKETP
ncbi:MAG: MFS transporter [Tessaracoccus sp.]